MYEDIETWFIDSVSSHHVTGLWEVIPSFIEIVFDCYIGLGTKTRHEEKGIGTKKFQLEAGGSLVIEHMLLFEKLRGGVNQYLLLLFIILNSLIKTIYLFRYNVIMNIKAS